MDSKSLAKQFWTRLKRQAYVLAIILGLMWGLWLFGSITGIDLAQFAIVPRTLKGLLGIVCAPFLHSSLGHIAGNSLAFLILGWLVLAGGERQFLGVTLFVMLVAGLGTWVFGSVARHLGASGIIFGYLGYLLFRGFLEKSAVWIFVSILVGALVVALGWGRGAADPATSWSAHFFGFFGGVLAAQRIARRKRLLERIQIKM